MRAAGGELRTGEPVITFTFEGEPVEARPGETIAAALTAKGIRTLRVTRDGKPRGLYCGMGVCQECLVDIDGQAAQRACMTKITKPIVVRRHVTPARVPVIAPVQRSAPSFPPDPDVLVIGGGAAGLTAASVAAECGARVVLVDERPAPGGQYFKQPHSGMAFSAKTDDAQFAEGRKLMARAEAAGVSIIEGMAVNAALPLSVTAVWQGQAVELRPRRLVVATGAYERALPVPGWTLPGVMTTGAAQTLLRSYRVLAGKRVVIAGNGPLNFQVAVEMQRAGADVVAVAELAPAPGAKRLPALAVMALTSPMLLHQGLGYLRELRRHGISLHFGAVLKEVRPGLEASFVVAGPGTHRTIEIAADVICMGYGFLPSNELLRLLGCRHQYDQRRRHLVTVRDEELRTTVPDVFGIGDCCGLNGARVAIAEGVVAGMAAAAGAMARLLGSAQQHELATARWAMLRHRRFQQALWQVFSAPPPRDMATSEMDICRCEGVTISQFDAALEEGSDHIGSIKRQSRIGMGRCQGRYCVPEGVERLCQHHGAIPDEFSFAAPRPPVKPVPVSAF